MISRDAKLLLSLSLFGLLRAAAVGENAAETQAPAGIGATVDTVTAKGITYYHPKVVRIARRGVTIQHATGLTLVAWGDLPEAWRRSLASQIPPDPTPRPTPTPKTSKGKQPIATSPQTAPTPRPISPPLKAALLTFDKPVELQPSVDLRGPALHLGLYVKNQGHRPSCSVYAIISALEIQYSLRQQKPVRFSEEHLLRCTRLLVPAPTEIPDENGVSQDAGYTLSQVIEAVRLNGLELLDQPPKGLLETGAEDVSSGGTWQPQVEFHDILLPNKKASLDNILRLLNQHFPIPIGLNWPSLRASAGGLLDTQPPEPGSRHAVTLVGYNNTSGVLEDTVFIFRNSYGPTWGASGYGRVTYAYLLANLQAAVVLDTL